MSWDIFLFNTKQKVNAVEQLDETQFELTDFSTAFEEHFKQINSDGNQREIKGKDFTIDYFVDDEPVGIKMVSLYGENGLYELVMLAKEHSWLIFDTGLGEMIDLENPSASGYNNFQAYLHQISKQ